MNAYASQESEFSRRIEEWIENASDELRCVATYVDRVIVPEVRREAGGAARLLAGHLERLARKLDPQPTADGKWDL